jgi:hypothetical protein
MSYSKLAAFLGVFGLLGFALACAEPPHEEFSFSCSQASPACPDGQWCNPADWCCHTKDAKKDFDLNACNLLQGDTSGSGSTASDASDSNATSSGSVSDSSMSDAGSSSPGSTLSGSMSDGSTSDSTTSTASRI